VIRSSKSLTSLEKGLDILSVFDSDRSELSVQEIAASLSLPLSTTYRYLDILVSKGFLTRDAVKRKILLGPASFRMGQVASSRMSLVDIAHPYMSSLSQLSGETVFLTVISGWEAMCLDKIEQSHGIRMSLPLGSGLPLHAGASAKVLLAYQDESFVENLAVSKGLPRITENTITDLAILKADLEQIRRQGYTISHSEVDHGATAIAAPILDVEGKVIAGLSIGGPSDRVEGKGIQDLVVLVKRVAEQISLSLGFMPQMRREGAMKFASRSGTVIRNRMGHRL
jgi:IclR family KDG regulon transcriptional repressor